MYLLYIGMIFILLGIYIVLVDILDINILLREKAIVRKEYFIADEYFQLKLVVGIFAVVVGILSITNYLFY